MANDPLTAVFWATWDGNCAYSKDPTFLAVVDEFFGLEAGGICAFQPNLGRNYACPAAGPYCWTYQAICTGSGGNTPGEDQKLCSNTATTPPQWCCMADERCPTNIGNSGVCFSRFGSPLEGASLQEAQAYQSSLLGTRPATIISASVRQTSAAVPYSTTTFYPEAAVRASESSSSAAATASSELVSSNHSALGGGAIAGIVIGVLVALVMVGILSFLLGRRGRQSQQHEHAREAAMEVTVDAKGTLAPKELASEQRWEIGDPVRRELP